MSILRQVDNRLGVKATHDYQGSEAQGQHKKATTASLVRQASPGRRGRTGHRGLALASVWRTHKSAAPVVQAA